MRRPDRNRGGRHPVGTPRGAGGAHNQGVGTMAQATGKTVLILATNGFEQSELEVPRDRLKAAGATVVIASPEKGEIKGWDKKDWGRPVKVDKTLDEVKAD